MLIGLPCTIGMCVFAGPILNLLFPNASSGEVVLQISALTIIFTILDQTINGALQGYGKLMIPTISLGCRSFCKVNFKFNISSYSTNWSKWSCNCISCLSFSSIFNCNNFIDETKPLLATIIMGICSYFIFIVLSGIIAQKLATILAIVSAVIIYGLAIIALKVFSKDEVLMMPYGQKICKILEKLKVY